MEDLLWLICGLLRKDEEVLNKKYFYDELKNDWDMHSWDDLVVCLVDFGIHLGRPIDGFMVFMEELV